MNEVGGKLGEESGRQCPVRPGGQLLEGGHLSIGCVIRRFWCLGKSCTEGSSEPSARISAGRIGLLLPSLCGSSSA